MNIKDLNKLFHCVYSIKYHLILVTKYRKRCITKPMLHRLQAIFSSLCEKWECRLLEFNGERDHIHLLLELTPKVTPSKFVNNIKTVSSRLIRKEFSQHIKKYYWKPIFWSRTYCLISCGGAPLSFLKQYIENQESPIS
jgi:putative transposase